METFLLIVDGKELKSLQRFLENISYKGPYLCSDKTFIVYIYIIYYAIN